MHVFVLVILILLLVFIGFIFLTRNFNYWKNLNVPFIRPVPLFGNIFKVLSFQYSIGDLFLEAYKSTETKYVGLYVGNQPVLLLRDPQLIKSVFIADFEHFADRNVQAPNSDDISKNVLFIVKNPAWKIIRNKVSPIFTSSKIKSMLSLIEKASKDLSCYVKTAAISEKPIDVKEISMKYTTDVVSSCAFGINAHSFQNEDAPFRVAARRMFDWNFGRSIAMSATFIAPFLVHTLGLNFIEPVAANFLRDVFWKHMHERETSKEYRGDFLDLLLEIKRSGALTDSDDKILLAQAVQFFFAGFETSGSTISFCLFCLAKHPDVQQILRNEIIGTTKRFGGITYEALKNMKYLDRVVCETLRLFPILPFLDRRCLKPYHLPGTNVVFDKGISVYVSVLGLHLDPAYFPDPHKFDPDRFTEENKAVYNNSVYMPFGIGPRNCIGSKFALMAVKMAVIQLVSEFEIETCSTTPNPLKFDPKGVLLTPSTGDLQLRFKIYGNKENCNE